MTIKTRIRTTTMILVCLLAGPLAAKDINLIEKWGDNLLTPVQIEDEQNILSGGKKHLIGIEEVKYVKRFVNCTSQITEEIEGWKNSLNLVARRQEQTDAGLVVEINTAQPVQGAIFIIYRFFASEKYAYLKFIFDSNHRLQPTQQSLIVNAYKLVDLKKTLSRAMECG